MVIDADLPVAALTIYPSSDVCTNTDCPCIVPLKKETQQRAVVYTHDLGVQPAWYIHIYCPSTSINVPTKVGFTYGIT